MMPDDYIQNHIEIETPHLRERAMTRYEQCWEKLQDYLSGQMCHFRTDILKFMHEVEEEICGPVEEEGEEQ